MSSSSSRWKMWHRNHAIVGSDRRVQRADASAVMRGVPRVWHPHLRTLDREQCIPES